MAGPLKPVPDPEPEEEATEVSEGPAGDSKAGDAAVLAERRARRAELAEQELRQRLAEAEERVAELELAADGSARDRAELKSRRERDAELASLVGEAANAVAAARQAVDREIHARQAAEAALAAERIGREAAEQAVVAERAARDAATEALVAARVRELPGPAPLAPAPGAVPKIDPELKGGERQPDEGLAAGIAAAAQRLRAQDPGGTAAPPAPAPGATASGAAPGGPSSAAPGAAQTIRSGGVVGWLERRFGRAR